MELIRCAVVLGVISLVTTSPSGYGIKSGALAGANANAAAGTFGGVGALPLSIPSGGSYSGSFSKSSSSSQASSSASSSSFSFSGTGSIPNAIGSDGSVIPGAGGCSSGTCQNGVKGEPGYATGSTGSGANAAAIAGAGAFVGSTANSKPCSTGDCSSQNQGCSGSNCNNSSNRKCTSGQCSPTGTASTNDDDILVNVAGSSTANSYNLNEKSPSSTATSSTNGCSNGNCGSVSNPTPTYSYTSEGSYPSSTGPVNKPATHLITSKEQAECTSPHCKNPAGGAYDTEHLPSSYSAPTQGSNIVPSSPEKNSCSTGNCAPSSRNPVSSSATAGCVSGNCYNKAPLPSTDFGTKEPYNPMHDTRPFVPLLPPGPTGSKYPSYSQQGSYSNTHLTDSGSGSNSFTGSYGTTKPSSVVSSVTEKLPPYIGGFGGPSGILKPNDYTLPSKIPVSDYKPSVPSGSYTPSTGSLLPHNQNSSPTGPQHKPTYNPTGPSAPQYQPSASTGLYKPPCTSGNCGNLPTTPYPIYPPYAPTVPANGPSYKPTGPLQQLPSESLYKPGSNNPAPCSTGNCGTQPQQPGYGTSTSTGSYVPTTCTSGNCGTKPYQPPNYDNIPSGSYKPTLPGSSYPSLCSYGNCGPTQPGLSQGGPNQPLLPPTGSYKPSTCTSGNCSTKPSQPPNYDNIPSGSYKPTSPESSYPSSCANGKCGPAQPGLSQGGPYKPTSPTGSYKPSICASGDCGSQSSQSSIYGQTGTSTSTATGSYNNQNKPTYGFGGPPGVLKPNDFSTPTVSSPIGKPTAPGYPIPTLCTSGNCGTQSEPSAPSNNGQYQPIAPGAFNPSLCTHGNCGSQSAPSNPSYIGQYKPTPSYGFGGPPGVLKPNDFSTPTVSSPIGKPTATGSHIPTSCTSGNCGTQAPSDNGQYQPIASGTHNPSLCTHGNCGSQSSPSNPSYIGQYKPIASGPYSPTASQFGQNSGAHSSGSATASANAVVYTGGFGGPPGLLKPYDDGKLVGNGLASFGNPQPVGSQVGDFGNLPVTGIQSSYGKSLLGGTVVGAGAGAQASAIAGAKSFSGGNYGSFDNAVGGCKDGCGLTGIDNYGLSGAAAKSQASAGAGAYGFSGSYASSSASAHASAGAATKGGYNKSSK